MFVLLGLLGILSLFVGVFIDFPSAILTITFFFIGTLLVRGSNSKDGEYAKVYAFSFVCSLLYTLACFIYMRAHNYDRLLINDTGYFIDTVRSYLGSSTLEGVIAPIWDEYDAFVRSKSGYITFLAFFGYLANLISADLYFTLQLATFAICSFGAVILYKLLRIYFTEKRFIYSTTILLTLLPMYFSYSTYILRDNLIALGFYYIILLMHKPPTASVIVKYALTVIAITTLRTESGYISIIFFPMYLMINNKNSRNRGLLGLAVMMVMGMVGMVVIRHASELLTIYSDNYESYFTDTGSGTISFLSSIPVVGNFLAVIYGVIIPMPCWARMFVYYMPQMPFPYLYNVMGFPSIFYVALNTYMVVYLFRALFTHAFRGLEIRTLKILLIPTMVFLLLQSGIVEPRRIMGVFPVFFLLWANVYKKMPRKYNQTSFNLFLGIFLIFQLIGFIRYI